MSVMDKALQTKEIPMGDYVYQGTKFPDGTISVVRKLSDGSPISGSGSSEHIGLNEVPAEVRQTTNNL